jgi:large subunit ribosomal protein L4
MNVKTYKGGKVGSSELDASGLGEQVLYRTLKESFLSHRANQRQGTVKTKGRSEVAGSRKKPWKQKHTGRARAGDRKSPIWRGGGTVFGPKPRDYSYHLPAKERRVALRSALLGKIQDGEFVLAPLDGFSAPSSKAARALLSDLGVKVGGGSRRLTGRRAVIVTAERDDNVYKSFRNFPGVTVRPAVDLCAFDVMAGGLVICQPAAYEAVAERVGPAHTNKSLVTAGAAEEVTT